MVKRMEAYISAHKLSSGMDMVHAEDEPKKPPVLRSLIHVHLARYIPLNELVDMDEDGARNEARRQGLVHRLPRVVESHTLAKRWSHELNSNYRLGGLGKEIEAIKATRIEESIVSVLVPKAINLQYVMSFLSQQPEASHVELKKPYKTHSNYARWLSQSGSYGWFPYHQAELDGRSVGYRKPYIDPCPNCAIGCPCEPNKAPPPPAPAPKSPGEIFAIADSGLDYRTCLFLDVNTPTPKKFENWIWMRDFLMGYVTKAFDYEHYKIWGYWQYMDGVDDEDGHGTHLTGVTIGGVGSQITNDLNEYQGLSHGGKTLFMDIG